jgi:hypothetical protein
MGMFNKIGKAISDSAVSAGSNAARLAQLKKCEMDLAEIETKYSDSYILIGKRVSEFMRAGEQMDDPKIKVAFERVVKLDSEKSELEAQLKNLKGELAESSEAEDMVAMEESVEKEIAKCKELLDMGVDNQQEYDRKVATLRNKAKNFKQLRALDLALAKNLISADDFKAKKAALLGQDIVE